MTRLVLREAVRRYGAGLTLVGLTGQYLWRSLPPWEIRTWLWDQTPAVGVSLAAVAMVGYVAATRPVVRILVASERLEYWRQFAISPRQWTRLAWSHLGVINLPFGVGVAYMLAPVPVAARLVLAATIYVGTIATQRALVSRGPSIRRTTRSAKGRSPWRAIARLYGWILWRREPGTVAASILFQCVFAGLCVLGAWHVATVEPDAAWPLVRTLALLGGVAAGWPSLIAARALAADRWFLDAMGLPLRSELAGRIAPGLARGTPTLLGVVAAGVALGPMATLHAAAIGGCAVLFGACAFVRIAAFGEGARRLHPSRAGAVTARVVIGMTAIHAGGPVLLGLVAAIEALLGARSLAAAAEIRARFETSSAQDDDG